MAGCAKLHKSGFGDPYHYLSGSLNFANPLSGLDQLFHGSNGLHGWGSPAAADPVLYYVRGFDPTSQRFLYEVNPRFGNTRPALGALYNPFRVTLDFSFSLNGNTARQQLEVYLRPTRSAPGVRPPADTILHRLRSTSISGISPYYWIIDNADSLLLTPAQLTRIEAAPYDAPRSSIRFMNRWPRIWPQCRLTMTWMTSCVACETASV
ncbi:MAG TPA: hypothetical protein VHV78_08470 [Gemmatimonadaceae bacterium]|nr:hypothetical protein [Gemmatimonadaceae bacterium]